MSRKENAAKAAAAWERHMNSVCTNPHCACQTPGGAERVTRELSEAARKAEENNRG